MNCGVLICLRNRTYRSLRNSKALQTNINVLRKSPPCDVKYVRSFGSKPGVASSDKIDVKSTIDQSEVTHHSKIKDEWWQVEGPMIGLHSMNRLRVPFIRDGLLASLNSDTDPTATSKPLRGLKILDVGCGGGILSEPLARIGANVTGIDASADLVKIAQEHANMDQNLAKEEIHYIATTIEEHAEKSPQKYDGVVASEIIEHVTNKELFVESCVKALKPGGSIFLTTLNRTQESWIAGIVLAENILDIVPKGTHEWSKFMTPEEMSRLLEKNGCKPMVVHGMMYLFMNNMWYWSSNKSLSYAVQAIKQSNSTI